MTTTYPNAVDEMFVIAKDAWDANAASICGGDPQLFWTGVQYNYPPDSSQFWGRISEQGVTDQQTAFSFGGGNGPRFTADGLLFIQLSCPQSDPQAMDKGRRLAQKLKEAYRNVRTPGGVVFFNAQIKNLPDDEKSYRLNVVAEYTFDEIGAAA